MTKSANNISQCDAAERIGVTIREMMRLIRRGIVPAAKVSLNRYLIDEKELDAAINELRRKQTEERINKNSPNAKRKTGGAKNKIKSGSQLQLRRDNNSFVNINSNIVAPSWDDL